MLPTTKLTKRQKKGIAFRQRKHNESSKVETLNTTRKSENQINVPDLEYQALVDGTQGLQGRQVSGEALVGKGKARAEGDEAETRVVVAATKKRKAGEEAKGTLELDKPKLKRKKEPDGDPLDNMEEPVEDRVEDGETGRRGGETKQRFILFLGNLKYTTTSEAIRAHFSTCVPPPTVRLLTPRASTKSPTRTVTKSKGCAFLEFKHRAALQQGLKLHQSELDGRQINVELTAGGGGKGLTRLKKLKERNRELEAQRKRQGPKVDAQLGSAQHFSTSGTEKTHVRKRTWTVGDVGEKATQRGQKHRKGSRTRKSLVKEFRTGVNAIPVG